MQDMLEKITIATAMNKTKKGLTSACFLIAKTALSDIHSVSQLP